MRPSARQRARSPVRVGVHVVHRRAQRRRAVRHVLGGERTADGEGGGLGGAVAVDQGHLRVAGQQGVGGVVRDRVAAGPDLPESGEAFRVLLDEDAEEGGGDPQGGDALGDGLADGGRHHVHGRFAQGARVEDGYALGAGEGGRVAVGEDESGAAAAEDVAQALLGVGGVQRHVRAARLQHGQHGEDQVGGAVHQQAHPALGHDPPGGQGAGQPLAAPVEFGVAEDRVPCGQGGGVRCGGDLLGEHLHRRPAGGPPALPAPLAEQPFALLVGHRRQGAQPRATVLGERHHQVLQVRGEPAHGGGVEPRRVVAEIQPQPLPVVRGEDQRVVGGLGDLDVAQPETEAGRSLGVHGVVLEDDQALEERRAGRQFRREGAQRQVLVAPPLRLRGLDPGQPGGHLLARLHPDAHGLGVDEQAQDLLGAGQVGRAARDGGAEDHVRGARVLGEQQRPGALHHRVDGEAVAPGEGGDPRGHLRGEVADGVVRGAAVARAPLRRAVVRQRGRLLETGQALAPVGESGGGVLSGQPGHVVTERGPSGARAGDGRVRRAGQRGVVGEDVGEEGGGAPAVEEQVVEGPDHPDALLGAPDQGEPHQRRGLQVDPARQVLGEEVAQLRLQGLGAQARPVQGAHRQRRPLVHHLHRLPEVAPGHGDPQRVRTGHRPLPGGGERPQVAGAVQGEGELLQVGRGVRLGQRVEDHAGLERGQRIDVRHAPGRTGARRAGQHGVHLGLGQAGQREVGRGTAARAGLGAVAQEVPQLTGHGVGQPLDGVPPQPRPRVRPGEDEPAVPHLPDHVQLVRARLGRAELPARVHPGRPVQRPLPEAVEPPQVVEADPGLGTVRQGVAEVAQGAVADAPVGDGAQLLLDRRHGRSPPLALGQRERHRVDRGEPADGAGQVEFGEEFLAAVALQVDGEPVPAGPAAQGPGQRGQQDVVDPGRVDRGHLRQQRAGLLRVERHGDRLLGAHGGVALRVVQRQRPGVGPLGHLTPVRQLGVEAPGGRVLGQPPRPLPFGAGLRAEVDVLARPHLRVGGGQVVQQDAPGDAVGQQVVDGEQDAYDAPSGTGGRLRRDPGDHPDQRPPGQVEPGLRRLGGLAPDGLAVRGRVVTRARAGQLAQAEDGVQLRLRSQLPGPPAPPVGPEDGAQRVVLGEDGGEGGAQLLGCGAGRRGELHGHVEVVRGRGVVGEEPLPDRGCPGCRRVPGPGSPPRSRRASARPGCRAPRSRWSPRPGRAGRGGRACRWR